MVDGGRDAHRVGHRRLRPHPPDGGADVAVADGLAQRVPVVVTVGVPILADSDRPDADQPDDPNPDDPDDP